MVFYFLLKLIQTVKVANHLHGLIFELKERMDSRQDQPVLHFLFFYFFKKLIIFFFIKIIKKNKVVFFYFIFKI